MLPVDAVLPELLQSLETSTAAVLVAPPGAGKTTRVPLALLDAGWRGGGRFCVLAPRRLAARAAAARMAASLGEPVGATVGYRVRLDSKVSAATRIEVVTTGVFIADILADPSLEDTAAVILDEFHERSLDSDLALALALDSRDGLRPDLRLLVMSATLDGARVAALLDGAPVVESEGRMFPVDTRWLGRDPAARIEDQMARAIRSALASEEGSILAFLPGAAEIGRVTRLLDERPLPPGVTLHPLMGQLDLRDQDAAIAPPRPGQRKVVLATSIAETSLTIEGVRVVIDSGLARRPLYEPDRGLTRLVTRRASRASADQRRGRAGRTAPGVCLRLWEKAEEGSLPAYDRPEILDADLSGFALTLAEWGVRDPSTLRWLDSPPAPAWTEAVAGLRALGALDADGAITPHGRDLSGIGLPPRLAHMIVAARAEGADHLAAELAILLTERGTGGREVDLRARLRHWRTDRSPRAGDLRRLAATWADPRGRTPADVEEAGAILALAFPDRIARARPGRRGGYLLANGRGAELDPTDALAAETWLAVADMVGSAAGTRILSAAPVTEADIVARFADQISTAEDLRFDRTTGRITARRRRTLGAIVLEDSPLPRPSADGVKQALLAAVREHGLTILPWGEAATALRARIAFARRTAPPERTEQLPNVSDEGLLATLDDWLAPALDGAAGFDGLGDGGLHDALSTTLPWDIAGWLDAEIPTHWRTPAGTEAPITWPAEGPPEITVRVQHLFGLPTHPTLGPTRLPARLFLTSPSGRPIQVTQDLPGFWAGSWKAVRTDMKARYPRHVWPEDPLQAEATTRAKPRGT